MDAQLVCDLLIDAGFNAIVQGGYLSGAIGELPPDTLVSVYLLATPQLPDGWTHLPPGPAQSDSERSAVSDGDFQQARSLIAEFEAACKANARALRDNAAAIMCSNCGEESDAGFGICWNCQAPLAQ